MVLLRPHLGVKRSSASNCTVHIQARQTSTGSKDLERIGASNTSPTPSGTSRGKSSSASSRCQLNNKSGLSAPERAQLALRARRNTVPASTGSAGGLSLTPNNDPGGENLVMGSPSIQMDSNTALSCRRRLAETSTLKQKSKLNDVVSEHPAKADHVLQPSSTNVDSASNSYMDSNLYSPIPVPVCTTRVWGAPPPKVFRGPWMSGVNRTSLDALTMEVALPTPPGLDNQTAHIGAGSLIPCTTDVEDHDETEMMDASINSPGLALLGGAFGISPNPRALSATFGADRTMGMMGCGSSVESPMTTVFYSPRLDHGYSH